MIIKAVTSFAGAVTMAPGDVREVPDEFALDYVRAGYAVDVNGSSGASSAPAATAADEPAAGEAPAAEAAGEPKKNAKRRK